MFLAMNEVLGERECVELALRKIDAALPRNNIRNVPVPLPRRALFRLAWCFPQRERYVETNRRSG